MAFGDYDFTLTANGSQQFAVTGSQVYLRSSTGRIKVTIDGGPIVTLNQNQGFSLKGYAFRDVTIKDLSGAPNSGVIFLGDAEYRDQNFTGSVQILNWSCSHTNTDVAVTNAAGGVAVSAANAARRYAFFQNNDPIAIMRLTSDGSAPTATHGVRLLPGASWEPSSPPTGAIKVISDQPTGLGDWVEG